MSLSNKLAITDVDLKDKRVLIRVRGKNCFNYALEPLSCYGIQSMGMREEGIC